MLMAFRFNDSGCTLSISVTVHYTVILVDSYDQTPLPDGDESNGTIRLANALSSSGLSITLTSLCSIVAFFVGSTVDIPGVSSFCMYAAWSFLANDILQFFIFIPLMAIDDHRIRKKRNFCCPCFCHHDDDKINIKSIVTADSNHVPSKQSGSYLSRILVAVMEKRICRISIIVLFLCTLSGSIYVIPSLETGTKSNGYFPDDSMIVESIRIADDIWGGDKTVELDIIIQNQDFSDIAVRNKVYELMTDLESQESALDAVTNWLDEFEFFLNETGQDMDTMDSPAFYSELQSFSNGTRWKTEILYDDPLNPTQIKSTRFKLKVAGSNRPVFAYPEYVAWNGVFDGCFSSDGDGYIFYTDSLLGFFLNDLMPLTATNMIFAAIGVFSVLILFVNLRIALFLLIIVSVIDIHLFGWMWALDLTLDATIYIECVMAVGLTVDYVIHVTHSIAEAHPQGDVSKMSDQELYIEKLKAAMKARGVSVWFVDFVLSAVFTESVSLRSTAKVPSLHSLEQLLWHSVNLKHFGLFSKCLPEL